MRAALIALMLLLFVAANKAAPVQNQPKVAASVVADVASVKPGDSFTLAVTLKTESNWHVYWRNPGDAGTATVFKLELPAGFKAEAAQFPLPVKFSQAGELVAYGYSGSPVFLIRVTAPAQAAKGAVEIGVDVSWLSCNDQLCLPGGRKLRISVPVGEETRANAGVAELFKSARAMIPDAEVPEGVVGTITSKPLAALTEKAAPFSFEIHWREKVSDVQAFPLTPETLELSNLSVAGGDTESRVSASVRVLAKQHAADGPMQFLITYKDAAGARRGFYTAVPLVSAGPSKN